MRNQLAGGLGFEPRLAESESAVLPLDDPPPPGCAAQARIMRRVGLTSTFSRDWVGPERPAAPAGARLLRRARLVGVAIDLQSGHAQPGDAVAVDRALPGEKFLDRQPIAAARLLQTDRTV